MNLVDGLTDASMTDEQFKTLCKKIDNVANVLLSTSIAIDIVLLFILYATNTR